MMKRIWAVLGYGWAILAFLLLPAIFIGNDFFAKQLVNGTGLAISPRCTGGEVLQRLERGGYQLWVHRPVFDGLIGERREGFVQVDVMTRGRSLPLEIREEVDYDRDNKADFELQIGGGGKQVTLRPERPEVIKVREIIHPKGQVTVRVKLKR
jgi:hypothetical protein